jgi:transposase
MKAFGQGKELSEDMKKRIADMYQNTRMSAGAISHFLGVSLNTVNKYKDMKIKDNGGKK